MSRWNWTALLLAALSLWTRAGAGSDRPTTPARLWQEQVEPLLDRHCFKCHGGVKQKGGLDLRSLEQILKGGERGSAVIPGRPDESRLLQFVLPGSDPHMPSESRQLPETELDILRRWIALLPESSRLTATARTNAAWPSDYTRALKASQPPAWSPPRRMAPVRVIDRFIELGWKERGVTGTALADDRTFARRIHLDLAGRIPTTTELEAFLADRRRDKRERLIDRLLASDDYARHLREVFDVVLMTRGSGDAWQQREKNQWHAFLERAFRENRPWNEIVREIITGRPAGDALRGAEWFLYERKDNHQAMAEAVAPLAFGVRIDCAQCHNHPLAWEIEQRHYWGLVAAFNRSKNVRTTNGVGVAESAIGGFVNFQNLKKDSQPALLAFLNGKAVDEKRPGDKEKEADAPELYRVPPPREKEPPARPAVPLFSRREALAEAVSRDNPQLARAFVNRAWALLMGRGLVHPVDQMDSRHRPSHPDLLDWLAGDFERSHYDVKRLLRILALTRTYQLAPQAPAPKTDSPTRQDHPRRPAHPPPGPEAFAHALEKPLSAEQLARSMAIATGHTPTADARMGGRSEPEIRQAFAALFPDLFVEEPVTTLQQAMFLSNSPVIDDLLRPAPGNTAARLIALPDPAARVRHAFIEVLGRPPAADELERAVHHLESRPVETGVRHLLWVLLAGAEFQVNH